MSVFGISPDPVDSHQAFKIKYELPFTLLSDPDKKIIKSYQAWGDKKIFGKVRQGVLRTTYVVGADGLILKSYENVKPDGHSGQVLSFLKNFLR